MTVRRNNVEEFGFDNYTLIGKKGEYHLLTLLRKRYTISTGVN